MCGVQRKVARFSVRVFTWTRSRPRASRGLRECCLCDGLGAAVDPGLRPADHEREHARLAAEAAAIEHELRRGLLIRAQCHHRQGQANVPALRIDRDDRFVGQRAARADHAGQRPATNRPASPGVVATTTPSNNSPSTDQPGPWRTSDAARCARRSVAPLRLSQRAAGSGKSPVSRFAAATGRTTRAQRTARRAGHEGTRPRWHRATAC